MRRSNTTRLRPRIFLSVEMRAVLTLSILCLTSAVAEVTPDYYTGAVLEYHPVDSDQFQTAAEVQQTNAMIAAPNVY